MRVRRSGFLPAPWLAVAALVCQSQAAASVEISVQRLENESIVARYVFDREITAFRFLVAEDVSRDQWQVDEASLTFAGNVVSSIGGAPFTPRNTLVILAFFRPLCATNKVSFGERSPTRRRRLS